MAGTLIINEKDDWLPARWIFDNILEKIAGQLSRTELDLLKILQKGNTEITGLCDLTQLDEKKFRVLVRAAEQARAIALAKGGEAFHDPSFAPIYFEQFAQLCKKLRADARAPRD